MDKNYKRLTIRLIIGALFIFASWWIVKCGCVNLKALTPAAVRDYLQSLGKFGWLAYIIAYALNTISVFPPIAVLSLSAGLMLVVIAIPAIYRIMRRIKEKNR